MRDLIRLIEQAEQNSNLIVRSAFLYLDPTGDHSEFAQCSSCGMFIPGQQRCWLFGKNDKVVANASCGLYIQGQPSNDQQPQNKVTPEQAGYNLGQVRCENCSWLNGDQCDLFDLLNRKLPTVFDLDVQVHAQGCCNAWQK